MAPDWRFARRPFWIFSHVFAGSVVLLFIVLGFWQLDRLADRRAGNELVSSRIDRPVELAGAPTGPDLAFQRVTMQATYIDGDFVRVVNRSQGGAAGEHVIGIVELDDGSSLAVNRGFVPANAEVEIEPVPDGATRLVGWLQPSAERGMIGATDDGTGSRLPRLDTERVAVRLERPLPDVWLQLANPDDDGPLTFPDPVPLPPIDEGPHLGYAVQWFIFATLGTAFYFAVLRRQARGSKPAELVD